MDYHMPINSLNFRPTERQFINYASNFRKIFPSNNDRQRWRSIASQQKPKIRVTKLSLPTGAAAAVVGSRKKQPFPNDVVCARGRSYWDHPGNEFYRNLIGLAKNHYAKAPNRLRKSAIVTEIIRAIHNAEGRFVKRVCGKEGKQWAECNEVFVREKVTQSLRDGLSFKYRSSTTRKRERKAKVQEIFYGDIDRIVHANPTVRQKIYDLKQNTKRMNRDHPGEHESVSDERIMAMFDAANLDILETIKSDESMLQEMHRVTNSDTETALETPADHQAVCHRKPSPLSSPTTEFGTPPSPVPPLSIRSGAFQFNSIVKTRSLDSSVSTSMESPPPPPGSLRHEFLTNDSCNNYNDSYSDNSTDTSMDLDPTFMFFDEIGHF